MRYNKLTVFIGSSYPYILSTSKTQFISIVSLFFINNTAYAFYNLCHYKNDVSNDYKKLIGKKKLLRYI